MTLRHQIIGAVLDRAMECGASFGTYSRRDVVGSTGYVDQIKAEELPHPVCLGTDAHGRPYVAVRFRHNGVLRVEALFQRYTDDTNLWTSGGAMVLVDSSLSSAGRPYEKESWEQFVQTLDKLEIM